MAITLTQDSYRLWARIGPAKTFFGVTVTPTNQSVIDQLAQLAAASIAHEGW